MIMFLYIDWNALDSKEIVLTKDMFSIVGYPALWLFVEKNQIVIMATSDTTINISYMATCCSGSLINVMPRIEYTIIALVCSFLSFICKCL